MIEETTLHELTEFRLALSSIAEMLTAAQITHTAQTVQDVIAPSEVKNYLKNGWRYVGSFGDGQFVVVEKNPEERRNDGLERYIF